MPPEDEKAPDLARRALDYARERLGPRSEAHLTTPAIQALALSRVRAGARVEDAVLAEIHKAASKDRELANEFLAFFLHDLLRLGRGALSHKLRRFVDTWDLAQSVLGDVWPELENVRFQSRASFIALLAQRLSWKATAHDRRLNRQRRREDLRVEADSGTLDGPGREPSPVSNFERESEREQVDRALLRLPPRDQDVLRRHMAGESIEMVMQATGLSHEAARKAIQRAIQRARELLASREARATEAARKRSRER